MKGVNEERLRLSLRDQARPARRWRAVKASSLTPSSTNTIAGTDLTAANAVTEPSLVTESTLKATDRVKSANWFGAGGRRLGIGNTWKLFHRVEELGERPLSAGGRLGRTLEGHPLATSLLHPLSLGLCEAKGAHVGQVQISPIP